MKKVYIAPSVTETEVQLESAMLVLSSESIKVNNDYSEDAQLTNENVWNGLW